MQRFLESCRIMIEVQEFFFKYIVNDTGKFCKITKNDWEMHIFRYFAVSP